MNHKDENLNTIIDELCAKHSCHTVILYGSRARGDETQASDYDVLGIKESGGPIRDARKWNGTYLDIFIWPESKIQKPDESMLYMMDGKVLLQKNDVGTRFLKALSDIHSKGPKILPIDEIQARKVWFRKMLERAKIGDLEGNYRRAWLLTDLLESYFVLRGQWYLGAKQSLHWLKINQPQTHALYEAALTPNADFKTLEALVDEVCQNNH